MSFTVLSDPAVKALLSEFRLADVQKVQTALSKAFMAYSTGQEQSHQPHRIAIARPEGQTTLFMGATSPAGVGSKLIGVPPPNSPPGKTLAGVLLLCDPEGHPTAVLNASEVTAFRTALGAMTLFARRRRARRVVVFGAGKQALWHVRLALLLKGPGSGAEEGGEVRHVTFVNRSRERSEGLLKAFRDEPQWGQVEFEAVGSGAADAGEVVDALVREADAVFCTTPATAPLFSAEVFTNDPTARKGKYISGIGSYKPEMKEMNPELFRSYVASDWGFNPKGGEGSVIVVDSREGCFEESGEIIHGGVKEEQTLEIGELLDIEQRLQSEQKEKLNDWLENGFVIYKSVGIGIMDLAAGNAIVALAQEKGAGVSLPPL